MLLPDDREPCADTNALRNPYFGDLHVHTAYSFDAINNGVRSLPEDAYRFARGEAIDLPPYDDDGNATRTAQLDRPLDFAAVTDHSELFGETALCNDPTSAAYATDTCVDYRNTDVDGLTIGGLFAIVAAVAPQHADFCADEDCTGLSLDVWHRTQDAAEAFYDRTAACEFTTFVGYEWTGSPFGDNLHRNVIFKNRQVPRAPATYIEAPWQEELWRQLDTGCTDAGTGCDVLVIPHNSNISAGRMFVPISESFNPLDAEEARRRAAMEPLVELYQHKGSSECSVGVGDPLASEDELCAFENLHQRPCADGQTENCTPLCDDMPGVGILAECVQPRDFVRVSLGTGLVEQARIGANPFQWGFIASTDTHNAAPGSVTEADWAGHVGNDEADLPERLEGLDARSSPGGLAVVWAEENSRDALFDAMRRRETYATSGPRMVVRMFGGWDYDDGLCAASDLVEQGYAGGVPMGGELPARPADGPPRIAVSAMRDAQGAALQRIQIVKGWVEGGEARVEVFEVAGDPDNGADVDLNTCEPTGAGFDTLCQVWEDPDFDPTAPAYYYARVVENPTCRWSTAQCNAAEVVCPVPMDDPLAPCCDGSIPATVQERAWTSPIWYVP